MKVSETFPEVPTVRFVSEDGSEAPVAGTEPEGSAQPPMTGTELDLGGRSMRTSISLGGTVLPFLA